VFLKSLTLRGFKSFADKTVLEFEPGVTVVVGPNGSGKSNLVDAVAWVLGAQGPRTLRGGKMDDVIFAGTPDRPALGRAEVSLCIDNTAGLLPIEFSEVTITRTLFRAGDSEYQINGAPCRLLDIQELLSDSGIGRQQHVIVGQGQLDAVLNSRPEDRRAVVEEAAGILKFRKRRERAERRLEATEGNLLRLNDLLREVRRQLTPLQRQADAARRHGGLVEELRAIRIHLAGHEIAGLQAKGERLRDTGVELRQREDAVRARLRDLDVAVLDAEQALTAAGHGDLADALTRIEALRARVSGFEALLGEKSRGLQRELATVADEGVFETLVADAAEVRRQLEELGALASGLQEERAAIERAEYDLAAAQRAFAESAVPERNADDLRMARRDLETRREALARIDAELTRTASRLEQGTARVAALASEHDDLSTTHARITASLPTLRAATEAAREAVARATDARRAADDALRNADADAARWHARAETLAAALDASRDDAALAALDEMPGVIGPLVDHLDIDAGAEAAVHAVLGDAVRAVVVDGPAAARRAVGRLAEGDSGALLVVAQSAGVTTARPPAPAVPGARLLADSVRSSVPGLAAAVERLLDGALLVAGDWSQALDLVLREPSRTVVTARGDRFGGRGSWRLGGDALAATRAALDDASTRADEADEARVLAHEALDAARADLDARRRDEAAAAEAERRAVHELDGTERARARVHAERTQREVELAAVAAEQDALQAQREADVEGIAALEVRVPALEAEAAEAQSLFESRALVQLELDERATTVGAQRRDLDVRAAQLAERRTVLEGRLAEVDDRLARDPERRAEAERHRVALEQRGLGYTEVGGRLAELTERIDALLTRWRTARRAEAERAAAASDQLQELRTTRGQAEQELLEVRELLQRRDVDEAETRLRLETAVERLRTEHDVEPAVALDAPAPEVPEGTTLAGRARELERELRLMGPINPLALEEHDALLERHEFLQAQLEDVKASRRELNRVIKAVDQEIVSVFGDAFADVQRNFTELFTTLFPGGSGKLVLTDPDDLLNTGIEMEARPSGKNVRRLSLLSGGERSLTALAFLFAVFRARPSPFYLMDEVEAALDDVNLHRFLDLIHEFRNEAQLLVVSHQKRTMEAADCLYGVSMPPGGSSRVLSQRVSDDLPVA
jgi:chromosome segregation protein